MSDVNNSEPWRRISVIEDVVAQRIIGQGVDGYRLALELDRAEPEPRERLRELPGSRTKLPPCPPPPIISPHVSRAC